MLTRRTSRLTVVTIAAALAVFAGAGTAKAEGWLYFGGWYDDAIGRVGIDGSDPSPDLITGADAIPEAMTTEGEFLYWERNSFPVEIGRSRLDGSEVQPRFIVGTGGQDNAPGISTSDGRIYWSETRNSSGEGPSYLSSANLDGSGLAARQVSLGPNAASSVTVTGGRAFFITYHYSGGISHYGVARVRLDGRGGVKRIASNRPIVSGTLVAAGRYLYWVEAEDGTFIARASSDGSDINTHFRRVPNKGCHTRSDPRGGALGGRFYFLGCESGQVDRIAIRGHRGLRELRTGAKLSSGPVLAVAP